MMTMVGNSFLTEFCNMGKTETAETETQGHFYLIRT